jgi:hypothetical protein
MKEKKDKLVFSSWIPTLLAVVLLLFLLLGASKIVMIVFVGFIMILALFEEKLVRRF